MPTLLPSRRTHLKLDERSLIEQVETRVRRQMQARAVRMDFFGSLHVDPDHVYIDRQTGQRAVAKLKELLATRSGAGRANG